MWEGFLFSTLSLAFIVYQLLDIGHCEPCEEVPHCSFDLHISYLLMLTPFRVILSKGVNLNYLLKLAT